MNRLFFFSIAVFIVAIWLGVTIDQTTALFVDSSLSSANTFVVANTFHVPSFSPSASATPSGIASHIVISEVQISASGSGNSTNDFIELYNPTSSAFDLNGHRLVKRSQNSLSDTTIKSWTSTTSIQPYGYYLWGNSINNFGQSIGADATTSVSLADQNSIALRYGAENTGVIIDALSWNTANSTLSEGLYFSPSPGDGDSMERKAYSVSTASTMNGGTDSLKGNGFDLDDNATDFVLRSTSYPQNSSSSPETP